MRKLPSARQRTLSLFTGKTDLESDRARDGTDGAEFVRRRTPGRPRWEGGNGLWWLDQRDWQNARIEHVGDKYVAQVAGEEKVFPSLLDAAPWAERRV